MEKFNLKSEILNLQFPASHASDSARMNSAAEARFRVQAPNSLPRSIAVVAVDAAGEAAAGRLASAGWTQATFLTAASADGVVRDLAGRPRNIDDEIGVSDLVILVAGPGGHAHAVSRIGEACSRRRVTTTGFIVGAGAASDSDLSRTLAQIRPWSLMVVLSKSDDYIDDMLTALRA
jgi:hypothetical protein